MQSPTTGPPPEPAPASGSSQSTPGNAFPLYALAVLFGMNLLNYVDRYSFFAVGTHIQRELKIDEYGYGWLAASFMIVYTLVSPLMGWLGDRYDRRYLLASGVGLWSVATVGTAFSENFQQMFFWRALLGVGEATYGVIAPALLADLFEPKLRGRVMGLYFLALPVGGAIGYATGGFVADHWSWRAAFWVVGLPGLAVALAGLWIRDPGRGASEGKAVAGKADRPGLADYLGLFRSPTFLLNTAGLAAVTFVSGAYAAYGSTFYQTVRGMSATSAGAWIGGLTALAGLVGIGVGAWLADVLARFTRRAYLIMAGLAVSAAIVPGWLALLDPDQTTSLALLFGAMVPMAMVLGPCNTVTANVVPANRRATGYAVSIFLIHLFGDISSPVLIGYLSVKLGTSAWAASSIGRAFAAIGAKPVEGTNLTAAMLCVVPVMALAAVFFFIGARYLPGDTDRARKTGGEDDEWPVLAH